MSNERFFKETNETFTCTDCKQPFKSYHYWEICKNCNDGETWEGDTCLGCGGTGEHNFIIKDQCQDCLYIYLTYND